MRLSYRGAHYHHQPTPTDLIDSGISGQYRGQAFTFAYPRHVPVPQPAVTLKYRGVAYRTNPTGGVEFVPATPHPEIAPGERAVVMPLPLKHQVRQLQTSETSRVHLDNIRQRLQHRIDVAKANGDTYLLHELEKELHLFA